MPVSKKLELAQLANGLDINQSTGEVVTINHDTDAVSEGTTNLYLTNARVDACIALATGSNLNLSLVSVGALSDVDITTVAPTNGQALIWNSTNGEFEPGDSFSQTDFDTAFAAKIATDAPAGVTGQTKTCFFVETHFSGGCQSGLTKTLICSQHIHFCVSTHPCGVDGIHSGQETYLSSQKIHFCMSTGPL